MTTPIPNEHREAVTHALNLMDKDDIGNGGLSWGESENYADAAIAQMLRLGYRIAPGWVAHEERTPPTGRSLAVTFPGMTAFSSLVYRDGMWYDGPRAGIPAKGTCWMEIPACPPANPSTTSNTADSGKEMI